MNPDPINWTLAVMLLLAAAVPLVIWIRHPEALRRIAAHCLARAETVDRARAVYASSLRGWHKRLRIPEPSPAAPRASLEARSNDV